MKPSWSLLLLLLPCFLAPAAPAQEAKKSPYDEFVTRFRLHLKVDDREELAKLVMRQSEEAIRHADTLCTMIMTSGSSQEVEAEIAALGQAWKKAMGTDFVDEHYAYLTMRLSVLFKERARLVESYDKSLALYVENLNGARSGARFDQFGEEYRALAGSFEELGDLLNAGRCWTLVGNCFAESQRGEQANKYRACQAYGKALEAWDKVGVRGTTYAEVKQIHESLVASGFAGAEPAADGSVEGAAGEAPVAQPGVPALTLDTTFEPVAEVEAFQRPNYFADDLYQVWAALSMSSKGSQASFPAIQQGGPKIERTGSAQFAVRDAAATPREPLTTTGNLTLVRATLDDGGIKREWAFVAKIGLQDDMYQGRKANMGPSDQYLSLFFFNGASVVTELAGTKLRVLVDNLDGRYGSPPLPWRYMGLWKETSQVDMDSVVVGDSSRALPWSEHLQVGGAWYRLESVDGGLKFKATPVQLQTGRLRLDFKGEQPQWLVVKGTGPLENTYFDVCSAGKKALDVPAGDYQLVEGLIRKGKKQQAQKCLILPGDRAPSWTVAPGQETVMHLGAPFRFTFEVQKSPEAVMVPGPSVRVLGSAGESYDRFWNCVPMPEVSMRKAGTKARGKGEEMPRVVGDLDELTEDGHRKWSFVDVWRPLNLVLPLQRAGEEVELRLYEAKNKLLGEIESEWH